jgi:hypothetical protein
MAQELKKVLYETIVMDDEMPHRLKGNFDARKCLDELALIKYASISSFMHAIQLIVSVRFVLVRAAAWDGRNPFNHRQLPTLHALMIQQLSNKFANEEEVPRHTIALQIFQDTSLATLTSILNYEVDWAFEDGEISRSRVLGITDATVWTSATFTLGNLDSDGPFALTSPGLQSAFVSSYTEHGPKDSESFETSIRTLLHLSPRGVPTDNIIPGKLRLDIQCDYHEDLRLWLQEVSPHVYLHEQR